MGVANKRYEVEGETFIGREALFLEAQRRGFDGRRNTFKYKVCNTFYEPYTWTQLTKKINPNKRRNNARHD